MKKTNLGLCRICGIKDQLTFEHIPPKAAFNSTTRYISVSHDDYFKDDNILKFKPKGQVLQGGIGNYSLCKKCNNFLGRSYVPAYLRWVQGGTEILHNHKDEYCEFTAIQMEPLKILKQIISMFLSLNDEWYLKDFPELSHFVKSPGIAELPDKYRIFAYLHKGGQYRYQTHSVIYTPELGPVNFSEIAFPPYGYVLTVNFDGILGKQTDITDFKLHTNVTDIDIGMCQMETIMPFPPLDYRSKEEIEKDIEAAIQFKNNQKENSDDG